MTTARDRMAISAALGVLLASTGCVRGFTIEEPLAGSAQVASHVPVTIDAAGEWELQSVKVNDVDVTGRMNPQAGAQHVRSTGTLDVAPGHARIVVVARVRQSGNSFSQITKDVDFDAVVARLSLDVPAFRVGLDPLDVFVTSPVRFTVKGNAAWSGLTVMATPRGDPATDRRSAGAGETVAGSVALPPRTDYRLSASAEFADGAHDDSFSFAVARTAGKPPMCHIVVPEGYPPPVPPSPGEIDPNSPLAPPVPLDWGGGRWEMNAAGDRCTAVGGVYDRPLPAPVMTTSCPYPTWATRAYVDGTVRCLAPADFPD